MNEPSPKIAFLAVLIYDEGNGRRCEEPRVYHATHPEIAYQLALADGKEQRYGRRFVGLSHLEETEDDIEPIARSFGGDATELVVTKEELAAFLDQRWQTNVCDPHDLAAALREPPLLIQVDGLDKIRWHLFTHAYGIASELPKDIRRLASSDPEIRAQALWELFGSIYHQGTIYPATIVAVPFIIRLASDPRMPDPVKIWELLAAIAESSAIDPKKIREVWAWRRENFGENYAKSSAQMAEEEVATRANVRTTFLENLAVIRNATANPETADAARSILAFMECGVGAT
jgi:hypothetical protein